MVIIYLHQYFNTPAMSGGTRSYEMARRMVDAGHEVHMVTSYRDRSDRSRFWFESVEAGINVHWYPVRYSNRMSYRQRMIAFFSFAVAARRKAAELAGDIIFASSTPLTIALPAVPVARSKGIPMVFEVRDLWPEMPIAMGALSNPLSRYAAQRLEAWAYRNSTAIVALSPGMKEGVVRAGYDGEKVAVIPNSSDTADFKPDPMVAAQFRSRREWLGDRPLLVYTGTFGKINDVGYMIPLARELLDRGSDVRILLVGDGAERKEVIGRAKLAGVYAVNLFFEDSLPKKEMPALLSAATIGSNLVTDLPEARANSANKFFDTLAARKPVLLNHGGWMHDLVLETGCGLAMWRRPIADVAAELDEKIHDENWLKKAGRSAGHLAETHFDRDTLARQLINVLESAANGDPTNASSIAPGNFFSEMV